MRGTPDASDLLDDLRQRGVSLTASGDRLQVDAPRGTLTPADLDDLRRHKPKLLTILGEPTPPRLWLDFDRGDLVWKMATEPVYCSTCGGCDRWRDFGGVWHCSTCRPSTVADGTLARREQIVAALVQRNGRGGGE